MRTPEQEAEYQRYLAGMTDVQRRRFVYLAGRAPLAERKDLVCPDCGALMELRLGKYGRFYGCLTYKETGCQGSHSADDTGRPKGIPANQATRALRHQIVGLLKELYPPDDPAAEISLHKLERDRRVQSLEQLLGFQIRIASLDAEQCQKVIWGLQGKQLSRYDQILLAD